MTARYTVNLNPRTTAGEGCQGSTGWGSLGDFEAIVDPYGEADPVEAAGDRKSTRLNSSHVSESRMPSSA